jgi:hypothetical protein
MNDWDFTVLFPRPQLRVAVETSLAVFAHAGMALIELGGIVGLAKP